MIIFEGRKTKAADDDNHSRINICFVCDFFFPNMGGVEMHIWYLSQCLLAQGHKVIVVTHAYGKRQGIRYMSNGLKLYYLPLAVPFDQVIFPTLFAFFPLFRNVLIRENINLVHGHQSTSALSNECIFYARTMGYPVVYTDHSLFGLDDIPSIFINKLLEITLADVDHVIAVSRACRENLVQRAKLGAHAASNRVITIPNAVDGSKFTPDPSRRYPRDTVNIVLLSRLVPRKGIDLLTQIIPPICEKYRQSHFIIGGDGPLRCLLERMCEKHNLHHRVELLGTVAHSHVRDVLVRGHLFLNCSHTESFCMALLEAASCGLLVVSTAVGGIPEVLPPEMISLARPESQDLIRALGVAIEHCSAYASTISGAAKALPGDHSSRGRSRGRSRNRDSSNPPGGSLSAASEGRTLQVTHAAVCALYSWPAVALQTHAVYQRVLAEPRDSNLVERLRRYAAVSLTSGSFGIVKQQGWAWVRFWDCLLGLAARLMGCLWAVMLHILWCMCEVLWPAESIEKCPAVPWGSQQERF